MHPGPESLLTNNFDTQRLIQRKKCYTSPLFSFQFTLQDCRKSLCLKKTIKHPFNSWRIAWISKFKIKVEGRNVTVKTYATETFSHCTILLYWRFVEDVSSVFVGEAIFSATLIKWTVARNFSWTWTPLSVFQQLAGFGFLVTVVESFASHHPGFSRGFNNCKYASFFDVLLQCERGQRYCIFVKYEIYHQSISKHNV